MTKFLVIFSLHIFLVAEKKLKENVPNLFQNKIKKQLRKKSIREKKNIFYIFSSKDAAVVFQKIKIAYFIDTAF